MGIVSCVLKSAPSSAPRNLSNGRDDDDDGGGAPGAPGTGAPGACPGRPCVRSGGVGWFVSWESGRRSERGRRRWKQKGRRRKTKATTPKKNQRMALPFPEYLFSPLFYSPAAAVHQVPRAQTRYRNASRTPPRLAPHRVRSQQESAAS